MWEVGNNDPYFFSKNYHLNLTNRGTFQPTGSKSSPLGKGVTYPTSRLTGHFEKSSVQMYVKNDHKRKKTQDNYVRPYGNKYFMMYPFGYLYTKISMATAGYWKPIKASIS